MSIAAGKSSASFTIPTYAVTATTKVSIHATANNLTASKTLTVNP